MDQSFDPTNMSLDAAADLVAIRARLGVSRSVREKQAMGNAMTGALIGGGLGLGTGLLSTLMSKRKKKQWARNALLGTLLGAGVGGAGGMAMSSLGPASGESTSTADLLKKRQEMMDSVSPPDAGSGMQFGPLARFIGNRMNKGFDPDSITDPKQRALWDANEKLLADQGIDTTQAGQQQGGGGLANMINKTPAAAEMGAWGFGAGHLVDMLRAHRANSRPGTTAEISQMARSNPAVIEQALGGNKSLVQEIASSTPFRERAPGRSTPATSIPGPRGTSLNIPSIPIPFTGQVREGFRVEGNNGGLRDVNINPRQLDVLRETARGARERERTGKGGKGWGTALGIGAGFLSNWGKRDN